MDNFRSSERSNSAILNRGNEISSYDNVTDAFVDLYDAVEKIENDKANNRSASFPAQVQSPPGPSLGDLLHMNET